MVFNCALFHQTQRLVGKCCLHAKWRPNWESGIKNSSVFQLSLSAEESCLPTTQQLAYCCKSFCYQALCENVRKLLRSINFQDFNVSRRYIFSKPMISHCYMFCTWRHFGHCCLRQTCTIVFLSSSVFVL